MEIFDYPGEYTQTSDGETYVRARIEELQAEYEQVEGQSNARGLICGQPVQLVEFPRQDQNREYLVVSATHELESDAYTSGSISRGRGFLLLQLHRPAQQTTLSPAAHHPQADGPGPADRRRGGPSGRGDLHRQIRPRQNPVPLGSLRQE